MHLVTVIQQTAQLQQRASGLIHIDTQDSRELGNNDQ